MVNWSKITPPTRLERHEAWLLGVFHETFGGSARPIHRDLAEAYEAGKVAVQPGGYVTIHKTERGKAELSREIADCRAGYPLHRQAALQRYGVMVEDKKQTSLDI